MPLPFGSARNVGKDGSFLSLFFSLSLCLVLPLQVVIERTILTLEWPRMAHPAGTQPLVVEVFHEPRRDDGFAVWGPRASLSFVWNLDSSFSADVIVPGRVWARNVPSENSDTT